MSNGTVTSRESSASTADAAWRAVAARDASADGRVFYAVTSTGIYCRPSCPSRRPRRENVRFFSSARAAQAEGFRACRRCRPDEQTRAAASVARAKEILDRHADSGAEGGVSLGELAAAVDMSPFHLQRVFQTQLGLSPARYLRARRGERFKSRLRKGGTVSRATYDAGFGSSSRAYELADSQLGMTPATYRRGGMGAEIRYRVVPSSLGKVLVAATSRGVCAVKLGDRAGALERELIEEYPRADLIPARGNDDEFGAWIDAIVRYVDGNGDAPAMPMDVRGTAFQWRVWRALQAIPRGETRSYTAVAAAIGEPSAVRAVASACASNRVALVIPCHRVVRSDGALSGYRWGQERKRKLLEREGAATKSRA